MFLLRHEHESALNAAGYERFKERATRNLASRHEAWVAQHGYDALAEVVERGSRRAAEYGLRSDAQRVRFIESVLRLNDELAPDSRYVALVSLLRNTALHAEVKSRTLPVFIDRLSKAQLQADATG